MSDVPAPVKPSPPRRSALSRLLRTLVATAVVITAGVGVSLAIWTQTPGFRDGARRVAEQVLGRQLGEDVELRSLRVKLWPVAIEVRGLRIVRADGRPIVTLDRGYAPLVLGRRGPMLGEVELDILRVSLGVDADGKLDAFQRLAAAPKDPDAAPLERLPFRAVRLTDGALTFASPDARVELFDVSLTPGLWPRETFDAQLVVGARGLAERGTLHAAAVDVGPDAIRVGDLAIELPSVSAVATVDVPLGEPVGATLSGAADLAGLSAALTPPRAARGLLSVDVTASGLPASPRVELAARVDALELDLPGAVTPIMTYKLGEITVGAVAEGDRAAVDEVRIAWAEGALRFTGEITKDLELAGTLIGEGISLEEALRLAGAAPTPWVDMKADADIAIEGTLNPLHLQGPFKLAVADLRVGDRPISDPHVVDQLHLPTGSARGELELYKDRIVLRAAEVRGPRSRGRADIEIGFGPVGPLSIRADLFQAVLSDFQPLSGADLQGTGRITGRIEGPFKGLQFQGVGEVDGLSVTGIPYADHLTATLSSPDLKSLHLTDAQARRGRTAYSGEVHLDFVDGLDLKTAIVVPDGRIEDMTSMFVDLEGLTGGIAGTLWLDGPLYDMDGEAHVTLKDVGVYGLRFPTGEGHGYMDRGLFTLDDLTLRKGRGGAVLRGSVGRDYALDMQLLADGVSLPDLDWLSDLDQPLDGDVALVAHVGNVLQEPAPSGRLDVTDMRYANKPVQDSVAWFETTDGIMAVTALLAGDSVAADATIGLWDEQPYAAHAVFDAFPAHALYPVAADGRPVTATISGELDLHGTLGDDPSPVDLTTTLDDVSVAWGTHHLTNRSPWRYSQQGTSFEIAHVDLVGGGSSLELGANGGADELRVDGHGDLDLDLLRAVVPGLSRADGRAIVTLQVEGKAPDLQAAVDVAVDGTLVRHDAFPGTFEELRGTVHATSTGYDIDALAALGGGTVDITGRIDAEGWLPVRYDLDASARDAQVQWIDDLPPAIGRAELRFDGPVDALLLSGDIQIAEATFSDRIDWEDWVVEWRDVLLVDYAGADEQPPWFSMDVALRAPQTIRLQNNVADGTASADLRIIGDTSRPGMVGEVVIDDGLLYLQDREFVVERGVIDFRDPWTWDPELDFDLVTDITSREQRYRISYAVRGPFSDWRTSTRSDPPLAQADINTLLWFGVTADDLEGMGELSQAIAQGAADLILADLFVSTQVGDLREELPFFVERIEVVTGVNARGEYSSEPRLLVDTRFRELGDLHLTSELNVVRSDDQYLRLDQRLSDTWSLSAWYATQQRDRQLPIGGAYGVDLRARWETDP